MSPQHASPTTARQALPMSVPAIDSMREYLVAHWHAVEPAHAEQGLGGRICDLHRFNFLLWHEEDIARSPDVTDARIAQVKRAIDKYNQARNDAIEKVDDWLIEELGRRGIVAGPQAPAATETPGSAIDRLSILELRRFHMREQIDRTDATAEHREKAAARLAVLDMQRSHLVDALARLVDEIFVGQRPLRVFRQMKMYNDPSMNPYLYKTGSRTAA
jgi:cell division protein FtsB